MKISRGNSDLKKIKKSMRHEKWMRALMINRDIFLHGLKQTPALHRCLVNASLVPRRFHEYYLKYKEISERLGVLPSVLPKYPRALTYFSILQVVLMKAPGYEAVYKTPLNKLNLHLKIFVNYICRVQHLV